MTTIESCRNCQHPLSGKYCSNCGRPAKLARVNAHYVMHEITHVLHFEKGILFTIKELLLRPGKTVREFVTEDRTRLVKPIIFIIISSLVYSLVTHFFHLDDSYIKFDDGQAEKAVLEKSTLALAFAWIEDHYGYVNLLMGAFIAIWMKLFFRKYPYNFYELLILMCFVMGMSMLILAFFAVIEGLTKFPVQQQSGVLFLIYSCWAIAQFFDGRKVMNYFKGFFSYVLGMLTFGIGLVLLTMAYDYVIKH